jgi:choice-of-anchor A domain-containing protein
MKTRLGGVGTVLVAVVPLILVGSGSASATTTGDSIPLGAPFLYGEYAAGSSSVTGETVDGATAYGGDATITTSMVGAAAASVTAPGGVTMELGGSTNSVSPTTLAHGHGEYVGLFSGAGNPGPFTHVTSLPISFAAADSNLAATSSDFAALAATNRASGSSTLDLRSAYPGMDVFGLTEHQLATASNIAVQAPQGAVVVVNVSGSAPLSLSGQTVTLSGGVTPDSVVWNFPWVRSASFSLETWVGTILQPFGTLSMRTNTVRGSVLFGGRAARFFWDWIHLALFRCHVPGDPGQGTPEVPVSLLLPGSAIVLFGGVLLVKRRPRSAVEGARDRTEE